MTRIARTALLLCLTGCLADAAISIMPLKDVRAGQHGIGKTVFTGDKVEEFQAEILGVLENTGPKQSLILARLSGGPLEHTGVMQGMSGSPVYIEGKLIGAVAMAFPFAKDPIAGIRPIEEMLRVDSLTDVRPPAPRNIPASGDLASLLPARDNAVSSGAARMVDVATPISLSGFTSAAIERFAPGLRALGLEPRQGISLGGKPEDRLGDTSKLQPGSMISVELMTGDMGVGADGTLTCIDGNRIYAFGHRFLAVGPTEIP
ncbi:MAG TPA: SpoIVB peptidase S55 domain-containing protein, partial [Bryobacteraceae bacterium]|nr:SpoIVB peptidase S55 domain-containing protein [Bryobacteraceae bacterium]